MVKRFHDWFKVQKDHYQSWNIIPPDRLVLDRVESCDLSVNLDHCHKSLRDLLEHRRQDSADLYIITDLELSKLSLSELFGLYKECYLKSKAGIYIAALSYYLVPDTPEPALPDSYKDSISLVFSREFSYAHTIEDVSTVIEQPISVANKEGTLKEGVNFIFVHPNVKYFAWKSDDYTT